MTAGLDGEQPVTTMPIVREGPSGGYFLAPLEINVKLSFWPVGSAVDRLAAYAPINPVD